MEVGMSFRVTEIIDGDTFKVSPNWKWNNQTGDTVRANGYDTPEKGELGYEAAKNKLEALILNKEVILRNPIRMTYGRLLCDVYYQEMNIADHFHEYR
jgi:endonuclease YncB( thermonuclease family)